MTKQEIVVQISAARLIHTGYIPNDNDLKSYGRLADKIIEMFPEHNGVSKDVRALIIKEAVEDARAKEGHTPTEEVFDQYDAWAEQSAKERREIANA